MLDIPPPLLTLDGSKGIHLDLEALLSSRLLIQGSSRSGKSHLLRYILEQTAARIPQVVIDWEGEYASLREAAPYAWLGSPEEGADAPLRPSTARRLCRETAGAGASVIVDLSELDIDDRYETAGAFLDELMHLPKEQRRARLVAIDECHELAPQVGDVASSAAVRAIVSRGGKRGLCAVGVTQRVSRLDKSVAEAMNWIVGRTVLDVDVKRAASQLGFEGREAQRLKTLSRGRFYAFGPAIGDGSVQMVMSGEVRSHHPDGAKLSKPPSRGAVNQLLAGIRKGVDLDQLDTEGAGRQELLDAFEALKRQLADAKAGNTSDPADIRRAVASAEAPLRESIARLEMTIERMVTAARSVIHEASQKVEISAPPVVTAPKAEPAEPTLADEILAKLRKSPKLDVHALAKSVGSKATSSTFQHALAALRKDGLVEPRLIARQVRLTERGKKYHA